MADNWRMYGADTVACRLDKSELPGWIRKKVVVGPNEGAIVVRDGKPEDLVTEGRQKIQGFLSGLMDKVFGWITGRADVQVILIDLAPIRIPIFIGQTNKREQAQGSTPLPDGSIQYDRASEVAIQAITADKEVVSAEVVLTVMVNDADPGRFIGLLRNRRSLSRWDLAAMIRDELVATVLVPQIASQKAADLRANKELATRLCEAGRSELENSLRAWGLILSNFSIAWGLTDSERIQVDIHRQELEEEARKFGHQRKLTEMGRDLEIQRARIANMQELKVAESEGNEKLKDLLLASEMRREMLVEGKRVSVARIDSEVRVIQLDVEQKESQLRLEQRRSAELLRLDIEDRQWRQNNQKRLADIDADDKEMKSMVAMQIQVASAKHDRDTAVRRMETDAEFRRLDTEIQSRFEERKVRLQEDLARMGQVKDILTAGLSGGVVTADVMNTFLTESTKQSFGTTSDQKAAALFEAEKSKTNLETYKSAEDRERRQQQDMTKLSTDMMGAAKQSFGPQVVLGNTPGAFPPPTAPPAAPTPPAAPQGGDLGVRLTQLKQLLEQGLISAEDYEKRKQAIIDEL